MSPTRVSRSLANEPFELSRLLTLELLRVNCLAPFFEGQYTRRVFFTCVLLKEID